MPSQSTRAYAPTHPPLQAELGHTRTGAHPGLHTTPRCRRPGLCDNHRRRRDCQLPGTRRRTRPAVPQRTPPHRHAGEEHAFPAHTLRLAPPAKALRSCAASLANPAIQWVESASQRKNGDATRPRTAGPAPLPDNALRIRACNDCAQTSDRTCRPADARTES